MAPALSFISESEVHAHCCSISPPRCKQSPLVCPKLLSRRYLRYVCVWAVFLLGRAVHVCFIPALPAVVKVQILGTCHGKDLCSFSGEGFAALGLMQVCPREAVQQKWQGCGVWSKVQQRASVWVSQPWPVSLCLC